MSMIFNGKFIVICLFLATSCIGFMFIRLGPTALKSSPGVFHLGIRYADETSISFTKYPKGGPGANLILKDINDKTIDIFGDLKTGRNIIPIKKTFLADHEIIKITIESKDYKPFAILAKINEGIISPLNADEKILSSGFEYKNDSNSNFYSKDYYFKKNTLGIRLYPN